MTKKKRRKLNPASASGAPVNENTAGNAGGAVKRRRKEPGLRLAEGNLDMMFFIVVIILLVYGIIMMFSASYMEGLLSSKNDGYAYVRTQGICAVVGVLIMLFVSFFDYHVLMNSNLIIMAYVGMVALLTYTSFFGVAYPQAPTAHRWIQVGTAFTFQPSEAMKPVLIIFLAFLVVKNQAHINSFKKGWLPMLITFAPVGLNMVLQRHMSGLMIMCALFACVIVLSGMSWKEIIKIAALAGAAMLVVVLAYGALREGGFDYIINRVKSQGSIDEGINDANWQVAQSLIAIGSGGWFGLGFGESRQKYLWLPESQNDFIIAIIVEELGYIGGITVLLLFGILVWRGFRIASKAPDKFGMLIVAGLVFKVGFQVILNIAVACDAFPNTGVSLPFFSSGGTALMIQLAEMGIVLGVSRQCENI